MSCHVTCVQLFDGGMPGSITYFVTHSTLFDGGVLGIVICLQRKALYLMESNFENLQQPV